MGNRLSKIVTKTGDKGMTGLARQIRVAKDHPRIEAIGTTDELNSNVGLLLAYIQAQPIIRMIDELEIIQHRLFDLGGELVMPEHPAITDQHIHDIEQWIQSHNDQLAPLKEFILPSGSLLISQTHVCRTITRRLERRLVSLNNQEPINDNLLKYVNRLSDYFFILARNIAKETGIKEIYWSNKK